MEDTGKGPIETHGAALRRAIDEYYKNSRGSARHQPSLQKLNVIIRALSPEVRRVGIDTLPLLTWYNQLSGAGLPSTEDSTAVILAMVDSAIEREHEEQSAREHHAESKEREYQVASAAAEAIREDLKQLDSMGGSTMSASGAMHAKLVLIHFWTIQCKLSVSVLRRAKPDLNNDLRLFYGAVDLVRSLIPERPNASLHKWIKVSEGLVNTLPTYGTDLLNWIADAKQPTDELTAVVATLWRDETAQRPSAEKKPDSPHGNLTVAMAWHVIKHPGCNADDIAGQLNIHAKSVSRIFAPLKELGFKSSTRKGYFPPAGSEKWSFSKLEELINIAKND